MDPIGDQQPRWGHGGWRCLGLLHPYLGFDGFGLQRFCLASLTSLSCHIYKVYYCYEENAAALQAVG